MNRSLVIASTIAIAAVGLAGCGKDGGGTSDSTSASTSGHVSVKVDGKDISGVDVSKLGCVKAGDTVTIGTATVSGAAGVGVILNGNPPAVKTLAIMADGVSLSVIPGTGMGSAEVKVDGDHYMISGTGTSVSMSNPTAGTSSKSFEIMATCK